MEVGRRALDIPIQWKETNFKIKRPAVDTDFNDSMQYTCFITISIIYNE